MQRLRYSTIFTKMKKKTRVTWNSDTEIERGKGDRVSLTKCHGHKLYGFEKINEKVILNECEDSY